MLTRFIKRQLIVFATVSVMAVVALSWYYLRVPTLLGVGQYTLKVQLPASGGLYKTSNVTYRGVTIGKVTDVEPTERGVNATMSIANGYKIPIDASANVHSVSAIGEQYLDLVSDGAPHQYFSPGETIKKGTVPSEIGPALDAVNRGLSVLPTDKLGALLDEGAQAVGGLGPALQRLVDSTQALAGDFKANISDLNDIIVNSAPILDSQVNSSGAIKSWSHNFNVLAAQTAAQDPAVRKTLSQLAPTADQINAVFSDVRESLPQTLANVAIVAELLKRYNKNAEQLMVFLPQGGSLAETVLATAPGSLLIDIALGINQPPPCVTGFIAASDWRSPADTSTAPLPKGSYCKIPQDYQANSVRGSRNLPCIDVPGKRAATPRECRSKEPYVPLGTNPWYGDPNQTLNCPAPGARCDQPVNPGRVIPAPSVNNGLNPAPADQVAGTPPPLNDPVQRPGSGTVQCNGQQPNPCIYTPNTAPTAIYVPQSGLVVGPDGVEYTVENSSGTGEDGWKDMLAPSG